MQWHFRRCTDLWDSGRVPPTLVDIRPERADDSARFVGRQTATFILDT